MDSAKKIGNTYALIKYASRGMAMRRIFWGFSRNWVLIDPLQYLSSHSAFGFEFAEIFVIEKLLPDSASRRVGDSLTQRVGESLTLRVAMVSRGVTI